MQLVERLNVTANIDPHMSLKGSPSIPASASGN